MYRGKLRETKPTIVGLNRKGTQPDFSLERNYWAEGRYVAGIDEAGRGALAGPVVAAAVIFPIGFDSEIRLDDSKKLTPAERETAYQIIIAKALSVGVGFVANDRIDKVNILNATFEAMAAAFSRLDPQPDFLLVDGNRFLDCGVPYLTIVKGDSLVSSIAAASIVAKVERDRFMTDVAGKLYPDYEFGRHKGYGTERHIKSIENYGTCEIHRISFLGKYINQLNLFK